MTALYKSGDTIYQRKVKLNVRSLTVPRRRSHARRRTTKSVTPREGGAGSQPMAVRFVQSVLRGDVTPEESAGWALSEESGKNRTRALRVAPRSGVR